MSRADAHRVIPRRVRTDDDAEDRDDVERRPDEELRERPGLVEELLGLVERFERREHRRQLADALDHLQRRRPCEGSRRGPALG